MDKPIQTNWSIHDLNETFLTVLHCNEFINSVDLHSSFCVLCLMKMRQTGK